MKKILSLFAMLLVAASAWSLPVELTHHPTALTTKWYQIKTQDNWYLYYNSSNYRVMATSSPSTDDAYLFCFVGDEMDSTNVHIYNRARQRYMANGDYTDRNYGSPAIDYVEWNNDDSFYIYFYLESSFKRYLCYASGSSFAMTGSVSGSFTAVEVETTPLVIAPYNTIAPDDFHIPHNTLSNTGNEGYAKLIDQDKNTKWCVENNSGSWETIWLDFESDVWFIPKGYTLTTGGDTQTNPNRNPKEWVLYGKALENDEWTELAHVTDGGGLEAKNTTDYSFDITGLTEGYRYFRFEVRQINGKASNNNYIFQLAELQLLGSYVENPGNNVEPILTPTDFHVPHNTLSNTGNEGYAKLIDRSKGTKWCVENNSGAWETIWLDFKSNVWFIPNGYTLTTGNDTQTNPNRNPKEWVLYGKTFEDDEWTELAHVTDGGGLEAKNTTDYSFDITATEGYRYFRFEVRQINGKASNNNYIFQLAELTLRGTKVEEPGPPAPPALPFEPTADPSLATTKWYQITLDGQYLFYNSSNGYLNASSSSSTDDNYMWCFVGDESTGYKIYNRGRQAYMKKGFFVSGSGDEAELNYVELDSEDNFYIYYMNGTRKHYLVYNSASGVFTSTSQRSGCRALDPNATPLPTIPGDLNGDGNVDISDVNAVINMMLGKATQTEAGDVTGDGNVDISDVNAVINIMLGKTTPVTPPEVEPTPQSLTAIGYNIPHNGLDNEGNEGYAKLVDGDRTTKWCVENRSGSWETIWIDLKSNVAFKPTSYIMTTGNDTHLCPTRNPKNWKIYGRNSESESWTELAHVSDGSGLGTNNTTDYTFEFNGVTKAYKYYRFEVIENGGGDHWNSAYYIFQLGELTLVGVPQ